MALHIKWPKYWSFSFSTSPSSEYSGLISFRIDWFDLFAAQGILKSLLQHNSKASVLQCSAFFMVQLSHLYMTIGKTIALTIRTFVGQVMSLLINTVYVCHSFPSKGQAPFNFLAAVKSLCRVQLFMTLWAVAYQAPLSMGFSRQEYWSGLPFPSQYLPIFCIVNLI